MTLAGGATCGPVTVCKLSALNLVETTDLPANSGVFEFVTGTVAADQLYTITLFGINVAVNGDDVVSTASDPSPPTATFGVFEEPACGGASLTLNLTSC